MRLFKPNVEKMVSKGNVTALIKTLTDKDQKIRSAACKALISIGLSAIDPLIITLGDDRNENLQNICYEVIVEIGTPAVSPLIGALKHKNEKIRFWAAWALGAIKDPLAVEPLIAAMEDSYWVVRRNAAYALKNIPDQRAVSVLLQALIDPDVRENAGLALEAILNGQPGGWYSRALQHHNPRVCKYITNQLGVCRISTLLRQSQPNTWS